MTNLTRTDEEVRQARLAHLRTLSDEALRDAYEGPCIVPLDHEISLLAAVVANERAAARLDDESTGNGGGN